MENTNLENHIEEASPQFSMSSIIALAKPYLWFLLKWSWIALALGVLIGIWEYKRMKAVKPVYMASLSFMMDLGQSSQQLMALTSLYGLDMSNPQSLSRMLELMKSKKIVTETLLVTAEIDGKKDFIGNHYLNYTGMRSVLKSKDEKLGNFTFSEAEMSPDNRIFNKIILAIHKDIIQSNLETEVSPGQIVTINFKSTNEDLAYEFVHALFRTTRSFFIEKATERQLSSYLKLEDKVDSLKMVSAVAEQSYVSEGDFNLAAVRSKSAVAKERINREWSASYQSYLTYKETLDATKSTLENMAPVIQPLDEPAYPLPVESTRPLFMGILFGLAMFIFINILLLGGKLGNEYLFKKTR